MFVVVLKFLLLLSIQLGLDGSSFLIVVYAIAPVGLYKILEVYRP